MRVLCAMMSGNSEKPSTSRPGRTDADHQQPGIGDPARFARGRAQPGQRHPRIEEARADVGVALAVATPEPGPQRQRRQRADCLQQTEAHQEALVAAEHVACEVEQGGGGAGDGGQLQELGAEVDHERAVLQHHADLRQRAGRRGRRPADHRRARDDERAGPHRQQHDAALHDGHAEVALPALAEGLDQGGTEHRDVQGRERHEHHAIRHHRGPLLRDRGDLRRHGEVGHDEQAVAAGVQQQRDQYPGLQRQPLRARPEPRTAPHRRGRPPARPRTGTVRASPSGSCCDRWPGPRAAPRRCRTGAR